MLYDNAQLLTLYSEAFSLVKENYEQWCMKRSEWLDPRDDTSRWRILSALDADSEGVEGKFYCWTKEEFDSQCLARTLHLSSDYYRIQDGGNWEHEMNILMREKSDEVFLRNHGLTEDSGRDACIRQEETA